MLIFNVIVVTCLCSSDGKGTGGRGAPPLPEGVHVEQRLRQVLQVLVGSDHVAHGERAVHAAGRGARRHRESARDVLHR